MVSLIASLEYAHPQLYLWWGAMVGICSLAVLFALIRNINQQKPDVLPAPRMDRIARGGKDAWVVGEARDRC